jgi:EpsI family protein
LGFSDHLMTLQTHRILVILSAVATLVAFRSLALWNPDPNGHVRFQDWLFSSVDAIPQMYYGIAAALVIRTRKSFRRAMDGAGSPGLALPLLLPGTALFVWGHYVGAPELLLASFILISMGVALLWFGGRFAAEWLIPCVILAFAFPIPAVLTNQIFYPLRLWTADQAAWLLTLFGHPVYQEGNVIYGTNVVAQVIDSCSGLRAIEMLTLAAILFVNWSPADRLRGWLLIALAPLIAYGFNLIRVSTIVIDPTSDLSATHTVQGWLAFFGALIVVVLVDRLLGRLLSDRTGPEPASHPMRSSGPSAAEAILEASSRASAGSVGIAALLVALMGVSIWMPRWSAPKSEALAREALIVGPVVELPSGIGDWKMGPSLSLDLDFIWSLRFPQFAFRPYRRGGETVNVFVGYGDRLDRNRSLLSPKNGLPGRGWEVTDRSTAKLGPDGRVVERVVAHSGSRRLLTYHWYEGMDSVSGEALRAILSADQSPLRRSGRPRVIRIGTQVAAGSAGGEADGDRRLQAFAAGFAAAISDLKSGS